MLATLRRGLLALVAALVVSAGAAESSAAQPKLTPGRVHVVAEEATVVRELLRIEDSLTYDAVALKPSLKALAQEVRAQSQVLIGLCDAIIRDDAEISRLERDLHVVHAGLQDFFLGVERATDDVRAKLEKMRRNAPGEVSVGDLFTVQMRLNHLSQLSEMSTGIVSATHTAISSMVRNVKG